MRNPPPPVLVEWIVVVFPVFVLVTVKTRLKALCPKSKTGGVKVVIVVFRVC